MSYYQTIYNRLRSHGVTQAGRTGKIILQSNFPTRRRGEVNDQGNYTVS